MTARIIFASFLFAFGIAWGSLLWAGESRPPNGAPPTPVTLQEVWRAVVAELRQQGLSETQLPGVEDLDLPVVLPVGAGRRLRVLSACWDERLQREQFRLECGAPGQCLPFLVYVHAGPSNGAAAHAGSCRLVSGPRLAQGAAPKPAVRAGDRATAVLVSGGLRMTASVTCLERGREGDVIRVRGLDGHVFRGLISGPALLEVLPQ